MKRKKQGFSSRKSIRYRGTECLNCGQPLDKSDVYCPYCSQLNSKKQLSVKDFLSEFLGSILVYDSRLRHTLRDLLFHPGRMTTKYAAGQRLNYANPFRFFLSVSIIYFLIKGLIGIADTSQPKSFIEISNLDNEAGIDTNASSLPPDIFISDLKGDSLMAKKLEIPDYYSERLLDSLPYLENQVERSSLYLGYHYKYPSASSVEALEKLQHINSFKNRWLYSRMMAVKKISDDPHAFIDYFSAKIPFFLFFFAPFFALFFWMLYSRKKYTYMEHMIFIFHIFSFAFLVKLLIAIPELIFNSSFLDWPILFLLGPIYFYFALKRFYGQGHLLTFIKFVFLGFIFNTGFLVALIIFVTGTAAVY